MNTKSISSTNTGSTTKSRSATKSGSKKNNSNSGGIEWSKSKYSLPNSSASYRSNTNEKRSNQIDKLKKNIEKLESLKTKMPLSVYKREITKLQTRLKQLQNTKDLENAKPKRESSLRSYTSENRSVEQGRNRRRSTSTPTPSQDSGSPMNFKMTTPSTGGSRRSGAVNMSINGSMVGSTSASPIATPVKNQKLRKGNAQSQKQNNRANRDSVGGRKGNNSNSNNNVYFNQNNNNGNK
tara:strand:- start:902 stop:1615 length:714 start_codon:yes stop_codon:yes gene_type:complete